MLRYIPARYTGIDLTSRQEAGTYPFSCTVQSAMHTGSQRRLHKHKI